MSVVVVYTTANIEGGMTEEATQRAIDIALEGSDFVGCQEMQDRVAEHYVDAKVWGTVQGPHGVRARCSLYYRKAHFQFLGWGNPVLHISSLFKSATRYFIWASFRDLRTGRKITVLVIHLVPHADDAQGGISDLPRGHLVVRSIQIIVALVKATSGQVVVMGDFNIAAQLDLKHHASTDLNERFRAARLVEAAVALRKVLRTHGHNAYDRIFVRLSRGAGRIVRQWTRANGPGDHLAYSVAVFYTARRGWKR